MGAASLGSITAPAQLPGNSVAQFQTLGTDFSPTVYLSLPQSFVWLWSDGTTNSNFPLATKSSLLPGAWQSLNVTPLEAVTAINLGFDGSDGGWTNYFEMRPPQGVGAVTFTNGPLTSLQLWASSYNPITNTLDFSGFSSLQGIECFHCTNLEHVVVNNLPSLRRVCFENCLLRELDLSGNPELEDLRAALNAFTSVTVGGGTGPKVWHFCVRDNPQITQRFQDILTNFYSLQEFWIWNANQSGALTFVSTNLTDVEVFNNRYSYADFTGQSNMVICQVNDNQLTNLVLDGCTALQLLEAQNNRLTTAALDRILAWLDSSAPNLQSVNLAGNLEFPSSNGYAHYTNLSQRVFVNLDFPDPNPPRKISVRVQSMPAGRSLTVDGATFSGSRTFSWVPGSTHSIATTSTQNGSGRNYEWTGWSDGGDLSHLVAPRSNTTYSAQFLNAFTPVMGSYSGLFFETNGIHHETSGNLTLRITDRGTFSGTLILGGARFSLSGHFDLSGNANLTITRNGNPVSLTLALDMSSGSMSGTIGNGAWVAQLYANRAGFDARQNPATNYSGTYTIVFPGSDAGSGRPAGHGYGTLKVDSGGKVSLSGALGDATAYTYSAPVSAGGQWPFYLSLYGGRGSLLGWMTFANEANSDLNGELSWIKPAMTAPKLYPGGFTNGAVAGIGSRYSPPVPPTHALDVTDGLVTFEGGNLSAPFTNSIVWGDNNRITNTSANKLTLTVGLSKGTVNGGVTPPGSTRNVPFKGVLLQKQNAALGHFSGTNQTGAFGLGAP